MSGNGAYTGKQEDIIITAPGLPDLTFPSGNGGGCLKNGPFKGMQVNLGPAALNLPGGKNASVANPLNYNPRCVKRDLTQAINKSQANGSSILRLLRRNQNIADFQLDMQGIPGTGTIGVHVSY
jgi:tyrosinase